jgi:hypothetical protein
MKPQRVYPLVVEVPRGPGAVPADGPTGVMVALRPVVPGALVAPAEQSLEVSRPGARATFHVTPLARGRLPEARVYVLHDGRPVLELRTRMAARTQRLAGVLLLLALILPLLLIYYTRSEPLRGQVPDRRPVIAAGGEDGAAEPAQNITHEYWREGSPGEVLEFRLGNGLRDNLPVFPDSDALADTLAGGAGAAYGWLAGMGPDVRPGFWLGAVLLLLAFGSWVLRRPARGRQRGLVRLTAGSAGATLRHAETAETLPLSPPHRDRE